ncbi:early nodulin-75-like [Vicia villosa]|uniref:early nodulin-75-like n=1 Tax=Vicia villosa TaxID=3911 RepID=UPI00273B4048|nr:early nodulin-75-like [Vicia villosa]
MQVSESEPDTPPGYYDMNPPEGEPVPEYEPMPEDNPVPEYEPLPEDEPVPEYEPENPTASQEDQSEDMTDVEPEQQHPAASAESLAPRNAPPRIEHAYHPVTHGQDIDVLQHEVQHMHNQPEHPNEPVDEMEQEFNQADADFNQPQNNPPPITLDAMYAAIQRQEQRFQAMQTNQNKTLRLIREMQQEHRDYAIRTEGHYTEIATQLNDLNLRANGSPTDRLRRVRIRGASSSRNRNNEE